VPQTVDLAYAIGLPPKDAIAYLAGKGYAVGFSWMDVWQEAQAKSFTAAGVMKIDVLADLRAGLVAAQMAGLSRADYIDQMKPLLQKKGWWGKDAQTDPATGEMLGKGLTPRRLGTIFDTNMQSAYMAGRYKAFAANVADRPYWMYVAIRDRRTRPAHKAMHGRTFHHSDAIWGSIWPPNGFRCRCSVRALDDGDLQRGGINLSSSSGKLSDIEVPTSRRPGAPTATVTRFEYAPGKFFHPDPGFNYNPGRAWGERIGAVKPGRGWDVNAFVPDCSWSGGAVEFAERRPCIKMVPGQKTWKDYGRPDLRDLPAGLRLPAPAVIAAAVTREMAAETLAAELGLTAEAAYRVVRTPVETLTIWRDTLPHMVDNAEHRERYARFVLPTLQDPYEVYLTAYDDGGLRPRYIGVFGGKNDLMCIVRRNRDGSLFYNLMQTEPKKMNGHRVGVLVYGK
jgi:SPP1 gp7 family putative phage head morphogenesis protein